MKLPRFSLRELFLLVLVPAAIAVDAEEPAKPKSTKTPRYASTERIRGSRETQAFLEWAKSREPRYPQFAEVELDEMGHATSVGFHPCVGLKDDDIKHLRPLTALKSIAGDGELLTDEALVVLADMKSLESVDIYGAKRVTDKAIEQLQKNRPNLKIRMTYRDP